LFKQIGFDDNLIAFIENANNVEFFYNGSFIYYRGGTNWDNKNGEYHTRKTAALQQYLKAILK
jgi:hypothetical protein